jgi:hypothetical protein
MKRLPWLIAVLGVLTLVAPSTARAACYWCDPSGFIFTQDGAYEVMQCSSGWMGIKSECDDDCDRPFGCSPYCYTSGAQCLYASNESRPTFQDGVSFASICTEKPPLPFAEAVSALGD